MDALGVLTRKQYGNKVDNKTGPKIFFMVKHVQYMYLHNINTDIFFFIDVPLVTLCLSLS